MPPLPPLPLTARFTLHYVVAGGPTTSNSFFMKYTNSMSAADALTLATDLATAWSNRIATFTGPTWTLFETQCEDLNSQSGVNVTFATSHVGTGTSSPQDATSCVVQYHIAFRYKGGHPRAYVPGIQPSNLQDGNTWSTSFLGLFAPAWQAMITDVANTPTAGVGAMSQVVWHRYSSNTADFPNGHPTTKPPWPLATPVAHPVTAISVNPQVGSQRRRNQQG